MSTASASRSTVVAVLAGLLAFLLAILVIAVLRGGDAEADAPVSAKRLAGEDRYATAAAIALRGHPDGAPVVYLASEAGGTDALAAAALDDGPILVVPRCDDVPRPVLDAVRELAPGEVIALGGPGAICDDVILQVADAQPRPSR